MRSTTIFNHCCLAVCLMGFNQHILLSLFGNQGEARANLHVCKIQRPSPQSAEFHILDCHLALERTAQAFAYEKAVKSIWTIECSMASPDGAQMRLEYLFENSSI
eukprot:GILJ01011988.1.p1 GENE.GILJ01011988.1~~GILJ01011988.1.p1  ORF type:complete len:105 (-),score=5.40 GILJ01011988.1:419-733(-)